MRPSARARCRQGRSAVSSQSGALGLALLEAADGRGLGLSAFVSIGNKADVSSNDLLEFWEDDPQTSLIVLYLESFGNPRKFATACAPGGAHEADPRAQGRADGLRRTRIALAHGSARRLGDGRRRAVPPGRRGSCGHARGADRRRGAPVDTAPSAWTPNGAAHERRRARHTRRRRLRGCGPRAADAVGSDA